MASAIARAGRHEQFGLPSWQPPPGEAAMCVSMAPAEFRRTIVYAGEARRNGEVVHVAGYQNTVSNLARQPATRWWRRLRRPPAGNAMILHFPAVAGTMTQDNVVATDGLPHLLTDMLVALSPPVATAAPGLGRPAQVDHVEVFESGIYTVVLASDARAIPGALDQVPEHKRPALNPALFDWYEATFPGWPVALCCFATADAARADPMLWWFRPAYPEWLFAPAVDAHDGNPPRLHDEVAVDHWVIAGSDRMHRTAGLPVTYRGRIPAEVRTFLPDRVIGRHFATTMPNADFVLPVDAVRSGRAEPERRLLAAV